MAVPQLGDPNFQRAVVLMLEHSDRGAMGLVVNHPAPLRLGDVARGHGMEVGVEYDAAHVFVGGPVEPERGFVLHDIKEVPEAIPLFEGMFVSGSIDSLKLLFKGPPERFRLCLGYAGWGPGQIERELQEGAWITAEPSSHHILATPAQQMWEAVLKEMGIDPVMLMHSGGLQ